MEAILALALSALLAIRPGPQTTTPRRAGPSDINLQAYASASRQLRFTENKGQWKPEAKFCAQTNAVDMWVTSTGVIYDWHGAVDKTTPTQRNDHLVNVEFVGASGKGKAVGIRVLPGVSNYYVGKSHQVGIRSYGAAEIQDLYPGIDLVTYFDTRENRPRYDLIVHPGADPDEIRLRYGGAKDLRVDSEGQVSYTTGLGTISEQRQLAYQKGDHGVDYKFFPRQVMEEDGSVGFNVDGYRKDRTLVIDPLVYSTFLGGSGDDYINQAKIDPSGNIYATGSTYSTDVPNATGSTTYPFRAFGAKYDPSGNLVYATYIDSIATAQDIPGASVGSSIAYDAAGVAYILWAENFGGGSSQVQHLAGKLDLSGQLVTGKPFPSKTGVILPTTIFGRIVVTPRHAWVAIVTPVGNGHTLQAYQCMLPLTTYLAATAIGGPQTNQDVVGIGDMFFDANSRHIYITGSAASNAIPALAYLGRPSGNSAGLNVFVLCYFDGTAPSTATFVGGAGNSYGTGISVNSAGDVLVSGYDDSGVFPTTPGAYDTTGNPGSDVGFVVKLTNDLTQIEASTMLHAVSGNAVSAPGLPVSSADEPWVAFNTAGPYSTPGTFNLTPNAEQTTPTGNVVARLSSDLSSLQYASYLGNTPSASTITSTGIDSHDNVLIAGNTTDANFPTTGGAAQPSSLGGFDGFVTLLGAPLPNVSSVTSDRGSSNPGLAGGVGKAMTVTVNFPNASGTTVSLTSPSSEVVVNGGGPTSVPEPAGVTSQTFTVTAPNDEAVDVPVSLAANITGGTAVFFPITVKPFVQSVVLSAAGVNSAGRLTGYATLFEVPQTNQTLSVSLSPSTDLLVTPAVTCYGIASGKAPSTPVSAKFTIQANFVNSDEPITATVQHQGQASMSSSLFTILGPRAASMAVSPTTVAASGSSTLTLKLNCAPKDDQQYMITASSGDIVPTFELMVPAGQTSGTATVATQVTGALGNTSVTLSATVGAVTKTTHLTVTGNLLVSAALDANTVVEGGTRTLTVTIAYGSPVGQHMRLTSSAPSIVATFDSHVIGSYELIPIQSNVTNLSAPKTITLSCQLVGLNNLPTGAKINVPLTLSPEVVSVTPATATLSGGSTFTGTINLSGPYLGASPQTVTITSNSAGVYFLQNGVASLLQTVTINPGDTSVPFTFNTNARSKGNLAAVLTVTKPLGYATKTIKLTVTP